MTVLFDREANVVLNDVIEERDRISARFTYDETFSKPFIDCQPNSTGCRCEASIYGA